MVETPDVFGLRPKPAAQLEPLAKPVLVASIDEIPPEGRELLEDIAAVESPDYNVLNGGERFSSYADHPRRVGKGGTATAAGKYQFVEKTWDRTAKAIGAEDFSPKNQDKGAWWLAQEDYKAKSGGRDLLSDLKAGKKGEVRKVLSSTWEGLKSPAKKGLPKTNLTKKDGVVPTPQGIASIPEGEAKTPVTADVSNGALSPETQKLWQSLLLASSLANVHLEPVDYDPWAVLNAGSYQT